MDGEAVTRAVAAAKFKAANALDNKEGLLAAYAPGIFSGEEVEVKDFSSVSAETLSKVSLLDLWGVSERRNAVG
jgi:hypothetical protein